jgi:pyrroloquinoline quinone biosynthesis protein B
MLRIVVLGAAAGGGVPQWNCGCAVCQAARSGRGGLQSTQASIAISADDEHWFLINASPDLRQQLIATPQLHPKPGQLRHSPIAGVILTNSEVDAVAGLLSMREGSPFKIYAHPRVLAILTANSIFNVLGETNVRREPIAIDEAFEPTLPDGSPSGIEIVPFAVPGKGAWYLEGKAHPAGNGGAGDTLGLRIGDKASGRHLYFLAACAEVTPELKQRLRGASLVFFDGTVWRDDELIAAGLGAKGHIAMSGDNGAIAALADLGIDRKIFLHINNSNPALLQDSAERKVAERAGWQIPADGTELTL